MTVTRFPAARYRFDCVADTPLHFSEYAGSALRGAFGHALKKTVCVTRQSDCATCALYRACTYPAIFEPPAPAAHSVQKFSNIPAPHIVEPPSWGDKHYAAGDPFSFHCVVIGRALTHLPLIVHAWQRALAGGVGPGDGRAHVARIHHCLPELDRCVYRIEDGELLAHDATLPDAPPVPASVQLHFSTQLRLQYQGTPLRVETITAQRLLVGVVKRAALLSEFHVGKPLALDFALLANAARQMQDTRTLRWRDWTRRSSRQQQEMKLGGVIGSWQLHGDLAPFWPYLHLGQWLHVGKNASFGLGQYTLQTPPASPV